MDTRRTDKTYAVGDVPWIYPHEELPPRGEKLALLTVGGVATYGDWSWYGGYIAFQRLHKRQKEKEAEALMFIRQMRDQEERRRKALSFA